MGVSKRCFVIGFKNLGYHRIEAHINVDNTPSIRLIERVGMVYECTRKGFIYEFGDWTIRLRKYSWGN
ncbi:GNAT family N-acetyltransferase [Lentibacillus daqui]|uniref:GNAT family N-acetyltransferase n=1 Tax=Lentibacillus daqui TaxID=2911514 RepID=UPI003F7287D4